MSSRELVPDRRRRWLREIGKLFARIDDACARGDYESARTSSQEVVHLLELTRPLPFSEEEEDRRPEKAKDEPGSTPSQQRS